MDGERKLFEFLLLENPPLARIFNCLNIVVCVCVCVEARAKLTLGYMAFPTVELLRLL